MPLGTNRHIAIVKGLNVTHGARVVFADGSSLTVTGFPSKAACDEASAAFAIEQGHTPPIRKRWFWQRKVPLWPKGMMLAYARMKKDKTDAGA